MSASPRVLIADREPTRLGIRMALNGLVDVCAEVDSAEQAIRLAKREQPDVCLIGWDLPGNGSAAVRGVLRAASRTRVIVLADGADGADGETMLEAVRLGAVGFVPAGMTAEQLQRIVTAVIAHEAALPRSMILDLLLEIRSSGAEVEGLTFRESQVLSLLRRGHSTRMIARRLDITPVTVRRHISELVHKFGVVDRSELLDEGARWAADAGAAVSS